MDFFKVKVVDVNDKKKTAQGITKEIYPDFVNKRSSDLMVKGGAFYAVYDKATGLWSTDKYDVIRLVDKELWDKKDELAAKGMTAEVKSMASAKTHLLNDFNIYAKQLDDSFHDLDQRVIFEDQETTEKDFSSKSLHILWVVQTRRVGTIF